jgi:hypothetical protein
MRRSRGSESGFVGIVVGFLKKGDGFRILCNSGGSSLTIIPHPCVQLSHQQTFSPSRNSVEHPQYVQPYSAGLKEIIRANTRRLLSVRGIIQSPRTNAFCAGFQYTLVFSKFVIVVIGTNLDMITRNFYLIKSINFYLRTSMETRRQNRDFQQAKAILMCLLVLELEMDGDLKE